MNIIKNTALVLAILTLSACGQNGAQNQVPQPAILTDDAIGHSDQMIVVNHKGPRAQVFLKGNDIPLWFSSVRDGLAYLKSDEKTAAIIVAYVNDVGKAKSWEEMGKGNWIKIDDAFFVVGSDAVGGMGAPEFVPFSNKETALEFAQKRGGELMQIDDIDAEMVLAPVDHSMMDMSDVPDATGASDATMENMSQDSNMQMQPMEQESNK